MNFSWKHWTVLVSVVVIIGALVTPSLAHFFIPAPPESAAPLATLPITVSIQNLEKSSALDVAIDTSALRALETLSTAQGVGVRTKEFTGLGTLVEKIGEYENGTDGKYWHFYVNGKLAPVGAADYMVQSGDQIEWRFQAPDTEY